MNSENLKNARIRKNYNVTEFSELLKISASAYYKYESGEREPSNFLLCNMADILDVSTDYLLGRYTEETKISEKLEKEFNITLLERLILTEYLSLNENTRIDMLSFLSKTFNYIQSEHINKNITKEIQD